ncbi:MAG: SIR2 family protein [Candidatus Scalindua sp.]|nr:SIR2 family protein [Candidatus Scalindua sp.]
MENDYDKYKKEMSDDISTCLDSMGVQPILFIGSGLSQRYCNGPSWDNLLKTLSEKCPIIDKEYAYYKQKHLNLIEVGTEFSEAYREWAWGEGRDQFPEELFSESQSSEIYIKYKVSEYFENIINEYSATKAGFMYSDELTALINTRPHAIITTNYDRFLEKIFPDYAMIIGQSILKANYADVGEILKIHGCSTEPSSLVLTKSDYSEFQAKKKYLSAKLLTYFAEHPLVFLGYSAEDPNIRSILSDIDEILSPNNELIPNIYIVERDSDVLNRNSYQHEKLITIDHERSVRVKNLVADDFTWSYKAFGSSEKIQAVNPKILRALLARTYALVRHDIPKRTIEVNYETLEHAVSEDGELAKLYGITTLNNPSDVNAMYPFSLTLVGKELGFDSWHHANQLIARIEKEKGVNIKESDNKYHVAIMAGQVLQTHKYSQAAIDLLLTVKKGDEYEVKI